MDQGWKRDMSKEDACELARRSIYHATYRDAGSGGTAVVFHCGLDGKWEKVSGDDVTDLHHKYFPDEKMVPTTGDPVIG